MIYFIGDTHGNLNFLQKKEMLTADDYLIVCGDFGFIWSGDGKQDAKLHIMKSVPYKILFVDGNHENFDLLYSYPEEEWNGGKIRKINDNVFHLCRGEVFTIDGMKIFTMGGASSIDKHLRTKGISWWPEELPNWKEYEYALSNLEAHGNEVDVIVSHSTSCVLKTILGFPTLSDGLNEFFDLIQKKVKYDHWFFGHYHVDQVLNNGKEVALFHQMVRYTKGGRHNVLELF